MSEEKFKCTNAEQELQQRNVTNVLPNFTNVYSSLTHNVMKIRSTILQHDGRVLIGSVLNHAMSTSEVIQRGITK
jgi:hypothetical protein